MHAKLLYKVSPTRLAAYIINHISTLHYIYIPTTQSVLRMVPDTEVLCIVLYFNLQFN